MKIVEDAVTILSHQMRSYFHVAQDILCLGVCLLASSVSFPYHARATNLFIFFTIINLAVFLYKIFRSDLYKESVKSLGAYGSKYRCFYAVYYPTLAFLCASWGGFKGYAFALIWIVSGGTYLVIADKIAKEMREVQEEVAVEIDKNYKKMSGCPYCKSSKSIESKPKNHEGKLKIKNTCSNKKCKKDWTEVYEITDFEVDVKHIPTMELAREVFAR